MVDEEWTTWLLRKDIGRAEPYIATSERRRKYFIHAGEIRDFFVKEGVGAMELNRALSDVESSSTGWRATLKVPRRPA